MKKTVTLKLSKLYSLYLLYVLQLYQHEIENDIENDFSYKHSNMFLFFKIQMFSYRTFAYKKFIGF